jgi:hypothetical protein
MKDCVIYAAWLNDDSLNELYISTISRLNDCDFYVGFNHSTSKKFIELCHKTLPIISSKICDVELEVNSDASAYQAALQCYKDTCKEKYRNVYFIHNKGASHFHVNYINEYLVKFINLRNEVNEKLETYGGFCIYGSINHDMSKAWNDLIKDTAKFTYEKPLDIIWWCTIYAIKAEIVDLYINNIKDDFFKTKLDRYFFEASFPLIVDKFGFTRYTQIFWDVPVKFSIELLQQKLKEYNDINKLSCIIN